MNIEQYPLLQYIINKYTYIYNSVGLIIFDLTGYLLFLIDLYYNVCHNRLCEGTDEGPFIMNVWDCFHIIIGALIGVGSMH